jgi:hypothetical protein
VLELAIAMQAYTRLRVKILFKNRPVSGSSDKKEGEEDAIFFLSLILFSSNMLYIYFLLLAI